MTTEQQGAPAKQRRIRIRFTNMTSDAIEELPGIGDRQVFTVEAVCTSSGVEEMADGEQRDFARMKVTELDAQGPLVKPTREPNLFSDDGDDEDDD